MRLIPNTIFWLLFLLLAPAFGGERKAAPFAPPGTGYLKTVWTTEQGLPQNSVTSIIQTRDGYLWLATFGGVARFDGVKFTTYNSGNTPGMKSNRILTLFEDRDGTLWMGAQSGEVMTLKNGHGVTYGIDDGLPGGFVWAINQAPDGAIWIGGAQGVAQFKNGRFKTYTVADGLPPEQIRAIQSDENGRLRFNSANSRLMSFDGEKFVTENDPDFTIDGSLAVLAKRKAGGFWSGQHRQLAVVEDRQQKLFPIPSNALPPGKLKSLLEDRDGALWLGFDESRNAVYRFHHDRFEIFLDGAAARSMTEDREGNIWIGSDADGLIRLRKQRVATLTTENGLPHNGVQAVTGDGDGGAWIATAAGLVHRQNSGMTTYTTKDGLSSAYLTALYRDRNNGLWIGSQWGVTYFKDGAFSIPLAKDIFANTQINVFYETGNGDFWIGTDSGLFKLSGGKISILRKSDGLAHDDVHMLAQTSDGALWIGTAAGLSRLKDGALTNYTTADGLSGDYVRHLAEDANGDLWLATYGGGLNRLSNGKISRLTTASGLFDDFVSRIIPDEKGNFWLLSNHGIFKVSRREINDFADGVISSISSVSYGVADGMVTSEGNGGVQPAGWMMPDGKIWFVTIRGLAVIDTQTVIEPPPVVIEQLSAGGRAFPQDGLIEIEPEQRNIEISYTGLNLARPEQTKFKYRLEPLGDDWTSAETRRTAYFSYLPPGEYVFKVSANSDGVWSQPAEIRFIVRPPFWTTWWFRLIIIICAAAAVYIVFRLRVRRIERRRSVQEEFSRRLISAHESERRRIAAELHDSIGQSLAMIKNSALLGAQIADDPATAKDRFTEISAQSAQTITEVREISYNLRPYLLDRLGLTKAVGSLLNKTADNLPVQMLSQIDRIDNLFDSEAELSIYRIVQEALNNIAKHASAATAFVSIERLEDAVRIRIEDDGAGFDKELSGRQRTGFGLFGIEERVRMLGGTFLVESERGRGTALTVTLNAPGTKEYE